MFDQHFQATVHFPLTSSNIDNISSEKNWERREYNVGLLGETQVCYLCAMQPPSPTPQRFYSYLGIGYSKFQLLRVFLFRSIF